MHQMRVVPVVLQQLDQPPQPNAASNATGVPIGTFLITFKIGATPLDG
jgi:hypothetical protein